MESIEQKVNELLKLRSFKLKGEITPADIQNDIKAMLAFENELYDLTEANPNLEADELFELIWTTQNELRIELRLKTLCPKKAA